MWLRPRCHKGNVLKHVPHGHGTGFLRIPEEALPGEAICVPVHKGGVLIMSNRTPHASFDNTSDVIRWSMDLRYQSASLPTNASIRRLPGEMIGGRGEEVPVACYPPEADFLVRSRVRQDEIVTSPEEFKRLREAHMAQPMSDRFGLYRFLETEQPIKEPAKR